MGRGDRIIALSQDARHDSPLSEQEILSLISVMRKYRLPSDVLPLAQERHPFRDLPDELIAGAINRATSSATRKGRFTDAVRATLGISQPKATASYTVIEAHIDLTAAPAHLRQKLISLGFEPDNFAEIQPPQYIHHFTIQHIIDRQLSNKAQLYEGVRHAATAAAEAIDCVSGIMGYVETECYTSRRILKFPPTKLQVNVLHTFPFQPDTFTFLRVANNDSELGSPGYDTTEKRAADIHVKLSPNATRESGEPRLESLLHGAGFYRIKSDAGNCMYSAHFSELSDSNRAYDELVSFANAAGGITSLMREVCTSLWRKVDFRAQPPYKAEVPPHLRYRAS